jgi:ubiquinone/menaquinone biosynthesis C-methylase UbiE
MQLFTLLLSPSYIAKAAMSSIMVTFLLSSPPTLQKDNVSDQISVVPSKDQSYDAFSSTYDRLNGGSVTSALGIDDMRRLANQYVSGDVLEIAVGTGLQSQYYTWPRLTSFVGIDVSEGMLAEARKRILTAQGSSYAIPIKLQQMDAKEMKFRDNQVRCYSMI